METSRRGRSKAAVFVGVRPHRCVENHLGIHHKGSVILACCAAVGGVFRCQGSKLKVDADCSRVCYHLFEKRAEVYCVQDEGDFPYVG